MQAEHGVKITRCEPDESATEKNLPETRRSNTFRQTGTHKDVIQNGTHYSLQMLDVVGGVLWMLFGIESHRTPAHDGYGWVRYIMYLHIDHCLQRGICMENGLNLKLIGQNLQRLPWSWLNALY